MAEKIVSPGVFTNEVDQSFLPAGVQAIGAALIGPTSKGPAGIPTIVSSYSEFVQKFGGKFSSGSGATEQSYKYLTNYAAQEYLKYADTLTVVRIAPGATPATADVKTTTTTGATFGSASFTILDELPSASIHQLTVGGVDFIPVVSASLYTDQATEKYVTITGTVDGFGANLATAITNADNNVAAAYTTGTNTLVLSGSAAGTVGNVSVSTSSLDAAGQGVFVLAGVTALQGGTDTNTEDTVFTLTTLSDGADQNSVGPEGVNNALASGSENNLRYEVTSKNDNKGTFNLIIRRGDDTSRRKTILEQYTNLTLDPNSPQYIGRVIGDQSFTLKDGGGVDPFLQMSGSFPNRSKYVRVDVKKNTYNYLDANGNIRDAALTAFLPQLGSGSFSGASDGDSKTSPMKFYDQIEDTNTQGINPSATTGKNSYIDAIRLLKNQDEYDINLLTLPGLFDNQTAHATVLTEAVNMVEDRADCFLIIDPVSYSTPLSSATAQAESRDSNYVAEYWPWVKIPDPDLGKNVWVPASTVIPSVYAFNDRVAAPWFAPAGLNRGGIDIAVQTERKLTHANRDTLYESNVNPIATFPNSGVVVFGQKTLQKKASALDRVNVRRLLIAAKKFIASTTKFLVFENNTAATRNRFLSLVNPYFENVQQRQGLYAFKVVMDETNNTPDVIDRNQMVGQIFLQPAKAAEFIIIDFNILPTGAAFPE
jgi:hypothetical protein